MSYSFFSCTTKTHLDIVETFFALVMVATVFKRYAVFFQYMTFSVSLAGSNSREGKGSVGGTVGGAISSLIVVSLIVLVVISGLWWWMKR